MKTRRGPRLAQDSTGEDPAWVCVSEGPRRKTQLPELYRVDFLHMWPGEGPRSRLEACSGSFSWSHLTEARFDMSSGTCVF